MYGMTITSIHKENSCLPVFSALMVLFYMLLLTSRILISESTVYKFPKAELLYMVHSFSM